MCTNCFRVAVHGADECLRVCIWVQLRVLCCVRGGSPMHICLYELGTDIACSIRLFVYSFIRLEVKCWLCLWRVSREWFYEACRGYHMRLWEMRLYCATPYYLCLICLYVYPSQDCVICCHTCVYIFIYIYIYIYICVLLFMCMQALTPPTVSLFAAWTRDTCSPPAPRWVWREWTWPASTTHSSPETPRRRRRRCWAQKRPPPPHPPPEKLPRPLWTPRYLRILPTPWWPLGWKPNSL